MKQKHPAQFRQGDVLIERVESLLSSLKPKPREGGKTILAHGEATGHAHAIAGDGHTGFVDEAGVTFLEVREAIAMLGHEEHGAIAIPTGKYRVTRQREYTPKAPRNVAD